MAITVSVEQKKDKEISFPCLMRSPRTGLIVLFTGMRGGVVLFVDQMLSSPYTVGYISDTWDRADSEDWEPSPPITLSNA